MTPNGDGKPGGELEDQLMYILIDFENFKKVFSEKALSIQGSGWCWLVFNATYHKIEIITTANQDSPWTLQKYPLLGLDVWEHAYYLKYQNKRPDYVKAWWNVVNWDYVGNRFSELAAKLCLIWTNSFKQKYIFFSYEQESKIHCTSCNFTLVYSRYDDRLFLRC